MCWFTLVGLVCAVAGAIYFYGHVDEGIRVQVERHLDELYPNLAVDVKSAKLIEREGFEIRGVTFSEADGGDKPLLFVDEILVRCRPNLEDLLNRDLRVQEVVVRHPVLHVFRQPNDEWNIRPLLTLPAAGAVKVPHVSIENGSIEFTGRTPGTKCELRDFHARIVPAVDSANQPVLDQLRMDLVFTSDHVQRSISQCLIDTRSGSWVWSGNVEGLAVSGSLEETAPREIAEQLAALRGLEARADFEFHVEKNPTTPQTQFHLNGRISNGRWQHTALAFPITDLAGQFDLTPATQRLDNVTGRYGDATLLLFCERDGGAADSPIRVRGNTTRLRVDRGLVDQLPPAWYAKWQKFQPLGLVDIDFQLDYAQGKWIPQADVNCHDVSFVWDKHPYPVERAAGKVVFRPGRCVFELHSISDKQPVRVQGDVHNPGKSWTGRFEVYADRPLPLDERLIGAFSEKNQRVIRAFAPQGTVTMRGRAERSDAAAEPYQHLDIDFRDGSVRHATFPYPLKNVSAHIERIGNDWRFTDIVGENDGAVLECSGNWRASADGGGTLQLHFAGTDVPLEDELRQALSPAAQHLWAQLRPQGTLDRVGASFSYQTPSRQTELIVHVDKLPSRQSPRGHSLSVVPQAFPYRIDDLNGSIKVANDQIHINSLRGAHGRVAVTTSGLASVSRNGKWRINFQPINVDRLQVDHAFASALPPNLSRALERLQLSGPVSVSGSVAVDGHALNQQATRAKWDLGVDLEDGKLHVGIPLEHICGSVQIQGQTDSERAHCRGRFNVDSMMCQGVQLTHVQGPLWIDGDRILIGKPARPTQPGIPAERVTARVFGGNVSADAEVLQDQVGKFRISASLENARAIELTRELTDARISGQAWANLNLSGTAQGAHTWTGNGTMQLRNTNLYELPFVLSLLNTLRTGSPDRTAFKSSDIAFHLQGRHIYFDQLDLQGDALTLKGMGEMDRQRQLNLDFYTMMGREDSYFPAVRPLLGMASRRFLLVRVTGDVDNPIMAREVLPDLNDTLRSLFPEAESSGIKVAGDSTSLPSANQAQYEEPVRR